MPLRPQSLGDFLSLPMKAITANRQVILGGPLLCVIASLFAVGVAVALFVSEQADFFRNFPYGTLGSISTETTISIVVAILVYIGTDLAARALVIPGVSKGILGQRISLGEAWAIARPRILQIFVLDLLITLFVIAAVLAILGLGSVGAVALAIPLILVAIPGVMYGIVLIGVAVSAIVLERISATTALSRASRLMRGSAWRLIGNYLVISFVVGFITQAILSVSQVVLEGIGMAAMSTASITVIAIIVALISFVIQTMVQYSFLGSLFTIMYVDLRIRTEGFDVDLARTAEAAAGR